MTDSNDQTDKTIRAGARKPLSLQRTVESGHVRQNFSHGRSKSVVVEKKKTRRLGSEGEGSAPVAQTVTIEKTPQPTRVPPPPPSFQPASDRSAGRVLSNEERAARERALAAARAGETAR
ncbi:MAG TPA: translation initiation factor IF-2 associated domain-containing protein, partial [Hyphomicrobium sp.]|nr:translation initiation factor IF-2 associated domain-containing protein [Hyphomicrobium sp.]